MSETNVEISSNKGAVQSKRGLTFEQPNTEVEITIASNAGACFGVVRAIKLGRQAALQGQSDHSQVYSFGPLIHNPIVIEELQNKGVQTVLTPDEVQTGTVVLRSHGIRQDFEKDLRDRGIRVVDATCPLVKKPQRIAQSLGNKGYFLIIVGDKNHPEIKGVLSYFNRSDYLVTYNSSDLDLIPDSVQSVGILAQTTIELKVFNQVVEKAKDRFKDVAVYNTICDATSVRQREAVQLASQADVMIVIGGKDSSNTNKLVKICKELQPDTYHVESSKEIEPIWFEGKLRIGVTGGASTPHETVDEAGEFIAQLIQPKVYA
jgi:4-hydroxy-3-methylbut-2-enyl diphosphate reductase